jgi:hypothetical protein
MKSLKVLAVLLLILIGSPPAFAIDTQTNLGLGADLKSSSSLVFVKGQWAAELIRILRLNLALEITHPHSLLWFEGQANAQLYPLNALVPKTFRYLPYLSAGAVSRQSIKGHIIAAGLDFLASQKSGINFSGAQAVLGGVKSTRIEMDLFWR